METILTDADYKRILIRIQALSTNANNLYLNKNTVELNMLRKLAIAYEQKKYDFTVAINKDYLSSIAG